MQSLVSNRWADILEEEASNSNSSGHDDLDQSSCKPDRSPKNVFVVV